jgi:hypothetical protein
MLNPETPRLAAFEEHPETAPRCAQCGEPLSETWPDSPALCLRCGLEADLFDREARWERVHGEVRSA